MKRAKVAIIGRPNVGKSALFNRICRRRKAIVHEESGVTRDRLYAPAEIFGQEFDIIDTGGIQIKDDEDVFQNSITKQAEIAVTEADAIIMVVDGRCAVTALDRYIVDMLLKSGKKITLAVNKIDAPAYEMEAAEFYGLGITDTVFVSAMHGTHIAELLELALRDVHPKEENLMKDRGISVAIVGRPNVGKSTLLNYFLDDERSVVGDEAGTTRDAIDETIDRDGTSYTFVDTAGIRKKKNERSAIDKFASSRCEHAINRSDVCLLVLDATQGITAQDKKIIAHIEDAGKACLLVFNKWDLVKGFRMEHCRTSLVMEMPFVKACPMHFISAKSGRNVEELYKAIDAIHAAQSVRIGTGKLNSFIEEMMRRYHPPMIKGKRLRIYYLTQVGIQPPRFVLFVNNIELVSDSYKKYLINRFREMFGFAGVPLFFSLRGKSAIAKNKKILKKHPDFSGEEAAASSQLAHDMAELGERS